MVKNPPILHVLFREKTITYKMLFVIQTGTYNDKLHVVRDSNNVQLGICTSIIGPTLSEQIREWFSLKDSIFSKTIL